MILFPAMFYVDHVTPFHKPISGKKFWGMKTGACEFRNQQGYRFNDTIEGRGGV